LTHIANPKAWQKPNGRQPQLFQEWKTTSTFSRMEDDLKFFKIMTSSIFSKLKYNFNFLKTEEVEKQLQSQNLF
jgi:hypothetical protein